MFVGSTVKPQKFELEYSADPGIFRAEKLFG